MGSWASSWAKRRALTRAGVGAASIWPYHLLWFIVNHAFVTERRSAGRSHIFRNDARRAEALATTEAPNAVGESSINEEGHELDTTFEEGCVPRPFRPRGDALLSFGKLGSRGCSRRSHLIIAV